MKQLSVAGIALLAIAASFALYAEDVQVSDISDGKVTLIGRVGRPLGTVVTVEGQLVSDPKQTAGQVTAAFRARTVDGTALEKGQIIGLLFRASDGIPALHANQLVKISGYESASFIGAPDGAREALGKDASPLDWKFQSLVHVIKVF